MSQALERIRKVARGRKKEKFTALFHHLSVDLFEEAFFQLKEDAAPGVDELTWQGYEETLSGDLRPCTNGSIGGRTGPCRVADGTYRSRTAGQRPLAVAALEDKIVQRAVAALLNEIYEEELLGFSYGFRAGRKVNWIVDADIRSSTVNHDWLIRMVEHRIGERRIIHLIQKWLKVGVLEDGVVTLSEQGTGQGAVISPLLANIYLHYSLDLWAKRWRRHDDFIVGFEHELDARRFLDEMRERLGKFALTLHFEKTRLIEFGRFAAENRKRHGHGKPETFNFLGFTFICGKSRRGKFLIHRKTRRDRLRAKLREVKKAVFWPETEAMPRISDPRYG